MLFTRDSTYNRQSHLQIEGERIEKAYHTMETKSEQE